LLLSALFALFAVKQTESCMKDIKALSDQVRQTAYDIHVYHGHGPIL
jgi:hypothetical protein